MTADRVVDARSADDEFRQCGYVPELKRTLGPYQTFNIGNKLPEDIRVIDRFRLILEIFGQRAQTRKAQLQVELAELRYELPRAEAKASIAKRDERPGFMGLGEYDESRERELIPRLREIHRAAA